jgi:hypothetical protein
MNSSVESILPASERGPLHKGIVIAFSLFASYCLGVNVALTLHEFGHALGCWIAGGKMLGLVLSPQGYWESYAARDISAGFAVSYGYLIHIAGGLVFGAAFAVPLLLLAHYFRRGTVGWIVLYATGMWAIGNNGMYLFLGSLHPFGDSLFLMQEGVPRWVLFFAGLPLVVAFLILFASFLRGIGLRQEDSYRRWVLTVEGGLLAYLAMIVVLRLLWPSVEQPRMSSQQTLLLACSPLVLLALASYSYVLRRPHRHKEPPAVEPRWVIAGIVFVLGLLFMATEVWFFSSDLESAALGRVFPPTTRSWLSSASFQWPCFTT